MLEKFDESQSKEFILNLVEEYFNKFHKVLDDSNHKISYAKRVYDSQEMKNLVDSALEFWLTSGRYTDEFEKEFSKYIGVKYCNIVNSGSSANLLAFMTLTSPLLEERAIKRGDEVITVAAGFPTTVAPIIQYGAVPVFVDVTIPEYNIDVTQLELAISDKTKAVMIAHTLGNPFDIKAVKDFCDKYNLWLIEDNCDALGSIYYMNEKNCYTGSFGDIGTSSFYPPHHITMGEGGAVYTNNSLLNKIMRSMKDWGRDCICPSGIDNLCGHRFDNQYGMLPKGYDHKYVYSHFGYNLKATDMQAAIGCAQIKKLPDFVNKRNHNFNYLYDKLSTLSNKLLLPLATKKSKPSWFGFPITCIEDGKRDLIVAYLEKNDVQTRMLFAGNLTKHPCFDEMRKSNEGFRIVGSLENTDRIMRDTFWVGVYPGMSQDNLNKISFLIENSLNYNY